MMKYYSTLEWTILYSPVGDLSIMHDELVHENSKQYWLVLFLQVCRLSGSSGRKTDDRATQKKLQIVTYEQGLIEILAFKETATNLN